MALDSSEVKEKNEVAKIDVKKRTCRCLDREGRWSFSLAIARLLHWWARSLGVIRAMEFQLKWAGREGWPASCSASGSLAQGSWTAIGRGRWCSWAGTGAEEKGGGDWPWLR